MKQIFIKLGLSFVIILLSHNIMATDYYFSSRAGDDSRTATQAQSPSTPWKSIDKLNSIFKNLKPGDGIYFKRSEVFYGTIHINRSGASSNPITISAYGKGTKPIITSLVLINSWKSIGGGKFESSASINTSKVNVVLMNDDLLELGRYPNSDAANDGYLAIEAVSGKNGIKGRELSGTANWKGGEVVIKKNQWIIDTQKISVHSGSSLSFENGSVYRPVKDWGFFIQNHPQTLDKDGEWYFNSSNRKMHIFFKGTDPFSQRFQASTLDYLLTKTYGASHIFVSDLVFNGANIDAISIAGGRNITFDNIEVRNTGKDGIQALSVLELTIENSKIINTYNNGLSLNYGNEGATVKNNLVENAGTVAGRSQNSDGNGIGILAKSNNTLIEGNVVRNTGYSGIYFGGNNSTVKYNLVENFVLIKGDGGGIYSFDGSSISKYVNRKISNNIILNAKGSWGGVPRYATNAKPLAEGIFLDDNSSGIEIAGNTVAHATNNALKMSNVSDVVVKDNTFFNGSSLLTIGNNELGRDARNIKIQGNVFFSKGSGQKSYSLVSRKDDIAQMGSFDDNYFFRPLGDEFSIYTRYQSGSEQIEKTQDLERWQKSSGQDKSSKSQVIQIEKFKIVKNIGPNLFENGSFNSHVRGINVSGGEIGWSSNKIDGGSLKVTSVKGSSIIITIGNVKKGSHYVLKFKAIANKKGAIQAHLRHHKTPWESVSHSTTFALNSSPSKYQTVLIPHQDVEGTVIRIATDDPDFIFWMDDLEIREVEAKMVDPEEKILFEYNASRSPKTIKLEGTYVDAKNNIYKGSVKIDPFGSVVLVKTSHEEMEEEPGVDPVATVKLQLPSRPKLLVEGESLSMEAEVNTNGAVISKVNFYCGLNLIGSSSKTAYQIIWKDIPKGKHYLWASAIDGNGKEIVSDELQIEVASKPNRPADEDDLIGAGTSSTFYFNTTANDSYTYSNNAFTKMPDAYLRTSGTNVSTNTIANKEKFFQKGRFGASLSYAIPVPNGRYTVITYHMETYFGKSGRSERAGQRVFDISLEGRVVKTELDMFLENGNKQTILNFENIIVKDGVLNLDLVASANNAIISGIAIVGQNMGNVGETEPDKDKTPASAMYFNTTSNDSYTYGKKTFDKMPDMHSQSSDTNISTNITASKEKLFQKGRFASSMSYAIPIPNGTYTVETYHMETYFGKSGRPERAGQRVFDISLEGKVVKAKLDMFLENGNKETVLTFRNIVVKDGVLNLDLAASANNAIISGIGIKTTADGTANLKLAPSEALPQSQKHDTVKGNAGDDVLLYPNPAKSQTILTTNRELSNILIYDLNGKIINNFDPQMLKGSRGEYVIPLTKMQHGLYMITLVNRKGIVDQLRLIVNP